MILSLQNTPVAFLMRGLRLRPAVERAAGSASAKTKKPAIVPHWIDFLNDGTDSAAR